MPPRRCRWIAALVVVCTAFTAGRTCTGAEQNTPAKLFDYREITLDNGLRLITLEDFSCPIVNVQVWYHVGSKDENPERQGFAHMFEHMMFRGTERLGPTDHMDLIRQAGGECNAYTAFDQTVYHETLAAHQLELALWLEADRMSGLKIDQISFDTERKVVEEERRMGLNSPFGSVFEKVMAEVFQKHPYRWTPIGKIPHLRAAAVRELRDFWNRYYLPGNATVVIAGAVKHAEAQQLVKRHFGWIPRGTAPPPVTIDEPFPTAGRTITIHEDNAPAPVVGALFRTVPLKDPDHVPLSMLARILVGDDSSRLHRALVAEKKLAVQVLDISQSLEQEGVFFAGAVVPPFGAKPDAAMDALVEEIEKLRTGPISDRELLKARNRQLKSAVLQTLSVEGKASALGRAAVLEGDAGRANDRLAAIARVTIADLKRVAEKYLDPNRRINVLIPASGPGAGSKKNAEEDAPITAEPEKEAPRPGRPGVSRPQNYLSTPPLAAALDVPPPTFAHTAHTLDNGLKVIVVPNREVPIVSAELGLLAGAWAEQKPGAASMALDMLVKGTQAHTEEQLADELGTYAISLSGSGLMDSATVNANCLTDQLDRTMQLLGEVVLGPTFPADEFTEVKKQTLTSLRVSSRDPSYVARRELRRKLYGEHPYARTATGETKDVEALTLDEASAWWKRFARPDMAVLILAGDIDDERAVALAKKVFGGWKAEGAKPDVKLAEPPAATATHVYLVDRATATQSQIQVGQLGITRRDPSFFTGRVVSGYFGGAFSSRLNETIRVKKGLTYGASGGFRAQRFAGSFTVGTFSKTESTADAVAAVFGEIKRLRSEPPTSEELRKTKAFLLGNFPLEHETPFQMADELWLIESNGLPADYFQKELDAVAKTNEQQCMRLVDSRVHPDDMVVVVVGRAEEVKEGLEKIAPVTVVEEKE
ncbi:MAG: insulinase family protein [Planctomycetia bacterium]|nr:insulinase family protein [Planctomycetia bacterium]